jgi:Thioredoxin-like domain
MSHRAMALLASLLILAAGIGPAVAAEPAKGAPLPPVTGPKEPAVKPVRDDAGLYHQSWFNMSFLDLRQDHADARAKGKRFAVIFEQRGCVYCTKMHTEVLSQRYINDYVRENFEIIQLDLFGAREVTDFDGRRMPEKVLAERWGVMFTPTVVFLKDELPADPAASGPVLEVTRMMLGIGAPTFIDMFVWIRARVYEQDRNFQRFHIARMAEREKSGSQ